MDKVFSLWEVGDLLKHKAEQRGVHEARLVIGVVSVEGFHSSMYDGKNEDGILYESLDLNTGGVLLSYLHGWVWEKADG